MTCIVGFQVSKGVVIAADSAASDGSMIYPTSFPKVFSLSYGRTGKDVGEMICAYTTSFRMGQIVQHLIKLPAYKSEKHDPWEYMIKCFVPLLREEFKDQGYLEKHNDAEFGGDMLVAFEGVLFHVANDFQVNRSTHNYMAIGSGQSYALGAMHAQVNGLESGGRWLDLKDAALAAVTAIEAAAEFSTTVRTPIAFKVLEQES